MKTIDLITTEMIENFNSIMKNEGTCLRLIENGTTGSVKRYKLAIVDKYIDSEFMMPNPNEECQKLIRNYFRDLGIELPYTNQVIDIWADKMVE